MPFHFFAQLPTPLESDLGKFVLLLAFIFLVIERACNVWAYFTGRKGDKDKEYATKAEVEVLKKEVEQTVKKQDLTAIVDRIDKRMDTMSSEQKELARSMVARYEEQNRQGNQLQLAMETMRREVVVLNHDTVKEIGNKLDDIDDKHHQTILSIFEGAGVQVPPGIRNRPKRGN